MQGFPQELLGFRTTRGKAAWAVAIAAAAYLWIRPAGSSKARQGTRISSGSTSGGRSPAAATAAASGGGDYGSGGHAAGGSIDYGSLPQGERKEGTGAPR